MQRDYYGNVTRGDLIGWCSLAAAALGLLAALYFYVNSRELSVRGYEEVAGITIQSPAASERLQEWKRNGRSLLTEGDLSELRKLRDREAEKSAMLNAKLRALGPAALDAPKGN